MKTLGIIGSGHLGQQIAYYAISDNHYENVVFFDDINQTKKINGFKILGSASNVKQCYAENLFDEILIGIGYHHMQKRKFFFELFKDTIPFGTIIHSKSWIDKSVIFGCGNVVYPGCTLEQHVVLGNNNLINIDCTFSHNTEIASHCFFSPRIALAGFVKIGDCVNLGISTTIINNISVNNGIRTGAGTIVVKSLIKPGLYFGNPAKFFKD